jgi:hypothetical protein
MQSCNRRGRLTRRRIQPSVNVPYAIPDPNVIRRAVGYAISIKGGLKVRNPAFVEACAAAVGGNGRRTVVVVDTKGGDLETEPTREGSGTLDATAGRCKLKNPVDP